MGPNGYSLLVTLKAVAHSSTKSFKIRNVGVPIASGVLHYKRKNIKYILIYFNIANTYYPIKD